MNKSTNKHRHKWVEPFDAPFTYICSKCGKHKIKETMYTATYYDENMNPLGLNEDNKQWKERYPKAFSSEKTDYKEGDIYENQLWCILGRFTDSFQAGHQIPFTDLAKVEK